MSRSESYLIDLLLRLIETESPTCCEKEIATLITGFMEDIGFNKVYMDENFNVVGDLKASHPGKSLLFLTHSDTSPLSSEQRPPKAELIEGHHLGKKGMIIKGPGAAAPKASIAAILGATQRLSKQRNDWKGCVKVAVVTKDLNVNHDGLREASSLIKDVDFAIASEYSNNNIVTAARGVLHIKVTIYGKSTHRGILEIKNNAIYKLGLFLENLKAIPNVKDANFGLTGFNPISLELKESPPALPEWVNLIIDRRVLPGESIDEILNQINSIKKKIGEGQIKVEIIRKMYPFQEKDVDQEKKLLKNIISAITGKKAKEIAVKYGASAAFLTHESNVPSLVIGPGNIADFGLNEHVEVESLENGSDIYYNFALQYLH